jgi:hypothetical protein
MLLGFNFLGVGRGSNFTIADFLKLFFINTLKSSLLLVEVVVGVSQEDWRVLFSVRTGNELVSISVHELFVFNWVLLHLVLHFELLFNSPEFNTPLLCSLDEKLFGVRESIVKVQQVVLREAETIGCTLNRRFVALTSSEVF